MYAFLKYQVVSKTTLGGSQTSNSYNFKTKSDCKILTSPSFSACLTKYIKTKQNRKEKGVR